MLGFSAIAETPVAALPSAPSGGPVTVTVTAASILMDGQTVAVTNGATMTAAQITYAGVPVAVTVAVIILTVAAAIVIAGQTVALGFRASGSAVIQYAGRFINIPGLVVAGGRFSSLGLNIRLGL